MSYDEMAIAKELFSDTHETDARVKYGNATGDATEKDGKWTVPVAIDNEENTDAENTKAATYVCDAYIAKGTRVKLVCDPTGRYIVCAWGDAIDKEAAEREEADNTEATARKDADDGLQTQIDSKISSIQTSEPIEISWTDVTPTISHATINREYAGTFGELNSRTINLGSQQTLSLLGTTVDEYGHTTYTVEALVTLNPPVATPKLTLNTDGTADLTIEIS